MNKAYRGSAGMGMRAMPDVHSINLEERVKYESFAVRS
jgi:hypothetical protein